MTAGRRSTPSAVPMITPATWRNGVKQENQCWISDPAGCDARAAGPNLRDHRTRFGTVRPQAVCVRRVVGTRATLDRQRSHVDADGDDRHPQEAEHLQRVIP